MAVRITNDLAVVFWRPITSHLVVVLWQSSGMARSFISQMASRFISRLLSHFNELAGLPALQGGESGQVRKEAATATYCKCRG
jgi:hypothetical protein